MSFKFIEPDTLFVYTLHVYMIHIKLNIYIYTYGAIHLKSFLGLMQTAIVGQTIVIGDVTRRGTLVGAGNPPKVGETLSVNNWLNWPIRTITIHHTTYMFHLHIQTTQTPLSSKNVSNQDVRTQHVQTFESLGTGAEDMSPGSDAVGCSATLGVAWCDLCPPCGLKTPTVSLWFRDSHNPIW